MADLGRELDWLLDDLVRRVPGVRHAVVLSSDGLAIGGSQGLDREDTEHLAAIAAREPQPGAGRGPPVRRRRRPADDHRVRRGVPVRHRRRGGRPAWPS